MPANRWIDKTQPQTLLIATVVLYVNGALALIDGFGFLFHGLGLIPLVAGPVAAGFGIANEKKWGYWLGIAMTALTVLLLIAYFAGGGLINLLFYLALLGLLLHPQSREYRKTWFR